jgi:endo-1,4-beta-xylanase
MKKKLFFQKGMKILSLVITKKVFGFSAVIILMLAACSEEKEKLELDVQKNSVQASRLKDTWEGGWDHGYWWSMWYTGGSCSMSFPYAGSYAGNFQVDWSGIGDGGGGKGWNPGGYRTVSYNVGTLYGYDFVGIYGWTKDPLIEYYITEFGSHSGTYVGTLSSDGGTYKVYKHQQVNQPSIIGTATFWQYFSDRTSNQSIGQNHSITTGNHFNYWKSKGGQGLGAFQEMKFNVEAMNGKSGRINATVW